MNGYDWERCHGFMHHMDEQHRRLNSKLHRLRDQVEAVETPRATILAALEALRGELQAHFREEEEGGCLEEAVCRCPSLAHEVRLIEAEHSELLEQLDAMIIRQRRGGAITTAELDSFAAAIDRHEAAEDHVVQHGFNVAVDA